MSPVARGATVAPRWHHEGTVKTRPPCPAVQTVASSLGEWHALMASMASKAVTGWRCALNPMGPKEAAWAEAQ